VVYTFKDGINFLLSFMIPGIGMFLEVSPLALVDVSPFRRKAD
jgi:hypothetical protein